MADSDDLLDDLIKHLRQQEAPEFPRDRVVPVEISPARGIQNRPNHHSWRKIMQYRSQLAAASIIAVVAAGVILTVGPLANSESFAFEQVQNAVEQARSVSYTITTTGWKGNPWPDPYVTKVMALETGRLRTETPGGLIIMNSQQGRFMRVQHKERKATIRPLYPPTKGTASPLDDFSQRLRSIASDAKEEIHEREIDGRRVVDFHWKMDGDDCVVTVDATTKLPIRMEVSRGNVQDKEIVEVFSDFKFDTPLDQSLFEAVAPDDYTVEQHVPDKANKSYPAGDAETLIVSPGSFGPVKSGMATDEIIRLLGRPDFITKRETTASPVPHPGAAGKMGVFETLEYGSRGFQLTVSPRGDLTFSCTGQASSGPLVRDFVGRTKEGIRLGASRDEVLKTYGKPELEQNDSLSYLELGWQFIFRDEKLCGILANRPMPKRREDGVQTRVLKGGRIIQAAPGVDIDELIDEDGNIKKDGIIKKQTLENNNRSKQ